jgi:pimeloyl-ACP methyl ester carboxylesterase
MDTLRSSSRLVARSFTGIVPLFRSAVTDSRSGAAALVLWTAIAGGGRAQPPAPPTTAAQPPRPPVAVPAAESMELQTSDGVQLTVWFYRCPQDDPGRTGAAPAGPPRPRSATKTTVILLHDLGGSHKSVEPLALGLQRSGCHVLVPDLRGHGASTTRVDAAGRSDEIDAKLFKRADLEAIAASAGGTVRDQGTARGDIEAIRAFLHGNTEAGGPGLGRLVVAGVGTGATLAALWTAADASWPPIATGPQGRQVQALVLVSPAWTPRGLQILPALGQEVVKRDLPILVVAGRGDREAIRVFDQLKRNRPQEWFEQRAGQKPTQAPKLEKAADATAVLLQLDTEDSGEKLLAGRTNPTEMVRGFLGAVLPTEH